ncbi:MAG: tRNA (adenosine(37)-N6)-threonylcarbamoyltransferase complex dimerization subunit type 1 TsaB [Alphaproteobacteria bacterium]|nr:tRNA (adenosine(37)-N6)-threonylcarbamoyltransferase complex dimerization subunit type 1 TsaB [Alphaproteobacteria bacterium]
MIVLGIDTALKSCSAAILRDGETLAERRAPLEKGHAERLAPMVAEALAEARVDARDLDRVGVVVGPGGFAGVRVGLAFARAFALGTEIQAVGVTSLAALAAGAGGAGLLAPVIDARRGQVYAALYGPALEIIEAPFVAAPEEAWIRLRLAAGGASFALCGAGAELLPAAQTPIAGAEDEIDPKIVARLAAAAAAPAGPPAPLYLRPPDAKPGGPSLFAELVGGRRS